MDCSPQDSSIHGIFQPRILKWVAIFYSRGSSWPRDRTWVSCIGFFTTEPSGKPIYKIYGVMQNGKLCVCAKSLQSCLTLCNPMNCSPPGSSVHGILQARILEWVAVPFSRESSQSADWTRVSCLLHWQAGSLVLVPPGKPEYSAIKKNEIMSCATTWMDLKMIILNKLSQAEKTTIWYHLYVDSKKEYKWTYLQTTYKPKYRLFISAQIHRQHLVLFFFFLI